MLSVAEAEQIIRRHVPDRGAVRVAVAEAAGGVLREAIVAERDQPPFDRVTMDGIAVDAAAVGAGRREFRVQATQGAGQPPPRLHGQEACVEIMTGAALPPGATAVIPVEQIEVGDGVARLRPDATVAAGANVHPRGSDYRGGATLLSPGTRLRGPEMAVLISAGVARAAVARRPRCAVLAVGSELVPPGADIEPYQIRSSNEYALAATLAAHGHGEVPHERVADDPRRLRERLAERLAACDVLVLSGGVSMGKYDYIPGVLRELGVEVVLHRVAQRPGKPMWFGVHGDGATVFALPGNPVSCLVCLVRYVLPALAAAMGAAPRAAETVALASGLHFPPPLTWFVPVALRHGAGGLAEATPRLPNTSGDFASLAGTDGFIELPATAERFEAGTPAPLFRW